MRIFDQLVIDPSLALFRVGQTTEKICNPDKIFEKENASKNDKQVVEPTPIIWINKGID